MTLAWLKFIASLIGLSNLLALVDIAPVGEVVWETLQHDGVARTYRVHVPESYDKSHPVALVIAMHGSTMTSRTMAYATGFDALSGREGFLAVYPQGLGRRWSAGLGAYGRGVDDIGFISALITRLEADYAIDPARIYATGASNGGVMTFMVGCQLSERIAAMAPVIGTLSSRLTGDCAQGLPVPALIINGTEDPLVAWEGRPFFGDGSINLLSIPESVEFWVQRNGCADTPVEEALPDIARLDGTRVFRESYSGATPASDVVLYRIEGGGHTWPGGPNLQLQWIGGRLCGDFSASEVIWEFFKAHPKP